MVWLVCLFVLFASPRLSEGAWLEHFLGLRPVYDYGLVMDAGSRGTRIHIYQWPHREFDPSHPYTGPLSFPKDIGSLSVEPGISSFANTPDQVGINLKPLIDHAKDVLKKEESRWSTFPLWLKATAGMRDLERDVRGGVMEGIRLLFQDKSVNPFYNTNDMVRVISGEEEGAYGWLSVNYAKGTLFDGPLGSYGAMDMGGASTQITFQPQHTSILENLFPIHLGDHFIRLYTHSFLGYGWGDGLMRSVDREAKEAVVAAMAKEGINPSSLPPDVGTYPPPPAVPSQSLKRLEKVSKGQPAGPPPSSEESTEDLSPVIKKVLPGSEEEKPGKAEEEAEKKAEEGLPESQRKALEATRALKVTLEDPCYPSGYEFVYPLDRLLDPDRGDIGITERFLGNIIEQAKSRKDALKAVAKVEKENAKNEKAQQQAVDAMSDDRTSLGDGQVDSGAPSTTVSSAAAISLAEVDPLSASLSNLNAVELHQMANDLLKSLKEKETEGGVSDAIREEDESQTPGVLKARLRTVLRLLAQPSSSSSTSTSSLSSFPLHGTVGEDWRMSEEGSAVRRLDSEEEEEQAEEKKGEKAHRQAKSEAFDGMEPFGAVTDFEFSPGGLDMSVLIKGTGDFDGCAKRLDTFFYKDSPCFDHTCSFNGIYTPRLLNNKFVGFGVYSSVKRDLGLGTQATLTEFEEAGRNRCKDTIQDVQKQWEADGSPENKRMKLPIHCFQAAWMHQILNYGYGFHDNTRTITFLSDFNGEEPGWTTGSMLFDVNYFFWDQPPNYWKVSFWVTLVLLLSAAAAAVYFASRYHKLRRETAEGTQPLMG
uniref:Peptidase A1 domain-containing protein n=1 Tax=Chromera velia CCMP2878 TaxID=1169474 RepID=A0A0G4F394_9ALVE|eukprot:Cvel_2682.t1-p1 / transcript=Cvel_2682.t1 / gene=Cvel_2682 / organism=Chromera_velia_CCMP2878 / gene_product=Ectonucleoside triphosphate diphosphohydrolase 5, putative / transcript_product=Ectonucleoside triphosphate diphosphohydrolase 5, putative / location=Cvel_scaffold107:72145-83885(-) / protein_length=817 / sequence_SO=supercontig / SO=protein_coding / is_pseudo=false